MKIFVAITLAVFGFVGAVSGTAQGCCTPDQWQGFYASGAGYSGPNPRFVGTFVQIFYDGTNSRLAANASISGYGTPKQYFIVSRNDKQCTGTKLGNLLNGCGKGKMYIVDLATSKCYVKDRSFKKACVPDDAKYMSRFTFGAGTDTLEAESYELDRTGQAGTSVSAWITVTAKQCVPVGVSMHGAVKGVGFMETGGYSNIKLSINDPSVFDVPAQCNKNAITTELPEGIHDLRLVFQL